PRAHAWKACWGQPLKGSNPLSSAPPDQAARGPGAPSAPGPRRASVSVSACGWRNPSQTLADREFVCAECGLQLDRDLNAARNIAAHAEIVPPGTGAPGRGEPLNARGDRVSPVLLRESGQQSSKREDAGLCGPAPPRRSNPP